MTLTPQWLLRLRERQMLKLYAHEKEYIDQRVDYYNRLTGFSPLPIDAPTLRQHTYKKREGNSVYFFDTFEFTRYFPKELRWRMVPGDVTWTFDVPTIAKTRPLAPTEGDADKTILMCLDKVRHFLFINDPVPFDEKQPVVLFRGEIPGKLRRIAFVEKFKGKKGFDVGDVSGKMDEWYAASHFTIDQHLRYRYIMALEGNDVASNLKWVMSSNSVAVMPRPTCESWFMEGKLVPNFHYIEVKPDYSDLEERINYYNNHPDEAKAIVKHAHEYVSQFKDKRRERVISYMVMKKYFQLTNEALFRN